MKHKIIFLDIDGVLNVIPTEFDDYGSVFHEHFIKNLEYIINETGAKIVITASCRSHGLTFLKKMWEKRNYPGEIIDVTPLSLSRDRGVEIDYWLKKNIDIIDKYVIIDDDNDFKDYQFERLIKTSDNIEHEDCVDIGYGLTKICAEEAIKKLNN